MKNLLKKSVDPYLALVVYRTSPLKNECSPSELLMCRKLHSTLPIHPSLLSQKVSNAEVVKQREEHLRQRYTTVGRPGTGSRGYFDGEREQRTLSGRISRPPDRY